jgi:hypothetical protein
LTSADMSEKWFAKLFEILIITNVATVDELKSQVELLITNNAF